MKQHGSNIVEAGFKFDPFQPIVYVNAYYKNESISIDWDIVECLSFIDGPGEWLEPSANLYI